MAGFVFSPAFQALSPWYFAGLLSWMGSVVHWLTLRGLHTDRQEVFSMDHRLTFRGLAAEGLGDHSREAASPPTTPAGTVVGL